RNRAADFRRQRAAVARPPQGAVTMGARSIGSWAIRSYLGLLLLFLYLPIVVMVVLAFNRSPLYELPIVWDTIWFQTLVHNDRLIRAGLNSIGLALANTVIASALGTMAAIAFARYSFRGKVILELLLFPPITIPWLIIGTSMLIFFFWV